MPENFIITNAKASANILAAVKAGTLIKDRWHWTRPDGARYACLLGSMHPKVNSPADCNGDLMPLWMAHLTVVLFDGLPETEINRISYRYGELIARWHVMTWRDWYNVYQKFSAYTIDEAVKSAQAVAADKAYWSVVKAEFERCQEVILSERRAIDVASVNRASKEVIRVVGNNAANDAATYTTYAAANAAYALSVDDGTRGTGSAAAYAAKAANITGGSSKATYLKLFEYLLDQIATKVGG
jgi:hypothetical protein